VPAVQRKPEGRQTEKSKKKPPPSPWRRWRRPCRGATR